MASDKFTVLSHEDQGAFDRLLERYRAVFGPKGQLEDFLVELMVHARWRLARIQRLEEAKQAPSAAPSSPDAILAAKLETGGKGARFLQRYRKSAEQSYRRAHRELTKMRRRPQPLTLAELTDADLNGSTRIHFADLGDFALRS